MEALLRGLTEKNLDSFLEEDTLQIRADNYKIFKQLGLVKNLEDALFGALFECIALQVAAIKLPSGGIVTIEEFSELRDLIQNRSVEIASKIGMAANR